MSTETLRGTVRRVFFSNPDSPFMAGVLETDDGDERKFRGKVIAAVGDKIELSGGWTQHPKFGEQFDAESGIVKMDDSPDALIHLLASHASFKKIGPARARAIVDAALYESEDGDAVRALTEAPDRVAARAGLQRDIVDAAADVLREKRAYFDSLAALIDQGWTNAQAIRINARLGDDAANIVRQNPYDLIGKITRFGFRTVDAVALKMGVKRGNQFRIAAGIFYVLDQVAGEGSTWTTRDALLAAACEELRPETLQGQDKVSATIDWLIENETLYVDHSPTGRELVASAALARSELSVFDTLRDGLATQVAPMNLEATEVAGLLASLNEGQAQALRGFSSSRFACISGGAGVGKTYLMRAVGDVAQFNGMKVAYCAPTGKAARRLAASTGAHASTIHRLLEPAFDERTGAFRFTRDESNQIEADLVIVDEFSMVDVWLTHSLLRALRKDCRLLLVGDHNQIPSVGPGAILRDLLAARAHYPDSIHVLHEIVRQAGILARNTTAVLDAVVAPEEGDTWLLHHIDKGGEHTAAEVVTKLVERAVCADRPPPPFADPLDLAFDVQVLAPMRKGPLGTWNLNVALQALRQRLLGCPPPEPTPEGKAPKPLVGDRIIFTKNDYDLDLQNGTQGIVLGFEKGGAMHIFVEDGREMKIPSNKRINVEVAWAMTIHKSQGSEWPYVLLVASSSHWIMHDRNLLYTGAGRAAKVLQIVGDRQGLAHFAKQTRSEKRSTFGSFYMLGWQPGRIQVGTN